MRRSFALVSAAVLLAPGAALAADPPAAPSPDKPAPAPAPAGWAGELDALSKWIADRGKGPSCVARCYALERLTLSGRVGEGPLEFELVGRVLADGAVDVPLFGPPKEVRLEGVTENDKEAAIGFEGDRYFLHTSAKRFVLKGKMTLGTDLTLQIPGPLNTLEANLASGAVVEGARLSGLLGTTIHLNRQDKAVEAGPTVFQLSRAVRVGREISFEYRLVMRSGTDLGVVRLPLSFGEKVLDVTGAAGFRVEGDELVLPTSGRTAEMTITGTLAKLASITPDARSGYEWWLLESDPEHRVTVSGDARQVDSAESPIPRTQPTSRLFLVQKGQKMEASVTSLAAVDALAAVVQSHQRTVVITARGDVVSQDHVNYENNGVDYLAYAPSGRPIFLSTGGKAERIMRQGADAEEILVPLRTGSQMVQVQSLSQTGLKPLFGTVTVPMPSYALTASRVDLNVGLPAGVFPLALLGGDRPKWAVKGSDLLVAGIGFGAGMAAVRPGPGTSPGRLRTLRILGGIVLASLWFLWQPGFVLSLIALGLWGLIWLVGVFAKGAARVAATIVLVGGLGLVGLVGLAAMSSRSPMKSSDLNYEPPQQRSAAPAPSAGDLKLADDRLGNGWMGKGGGVLEGVTPVPLPLPAYRHSMSASRELVTKERPFKPTLVYVTDTAVAPIAVLWLVGLVVVVSAHRRRITDGYRRLRERLDRAAAAPAEGPAKAEAPVDTEGDKES
ncbi:hypothetical protein [Polyangium spumosum]|uniref:Uncharacterized protein n=1 Tax=Polyangium spumosum TaxID=889282 RepID=A0A6N7PL01_9BACT|nr:hypothetical protein [Polyangium spumosum]MRG92733.1 hypothetical protein [Polyangium spumosum]